MEELKNTTQNPEALLEEARRLQEEQAQNHEWLARLARNRATNARLRNREEEALNFDRQAESYEQRAADIRKEEL